MTAPGYTIACTGFYVNNRPNDPTLGSAYLLLSPPGILLQDILVIKLDCGVRVIFPRRGVLNNGALRSGMDTIIRRPASFPDPDDWAAFSVRALAAIEKAFPGRLMKAANGKVLPQDKRAEYVPTPAIQIQTESASHVF